MGHYTLGKPNCPICKGEGVYPGEPRLVERVSGPPLSYPTVVRCSCLGKSPTPETPQTSGAIDEPDRKRRAAGDQ